MTTIDVGAMWLAMVRKLRLHYPRAIYHVMSQGRSEPGKGDPGKAKIAQRLRSETTMTLSWIAQRLKMDAKTRLSPFD